MNDRLFLKPCRALQSELAIIVCSSHAWMTRLQRTSFGHIHGIQRDEITFASEDGSSAVSGPRRTDHDRPLLADRVSSLPAVYRRSGWLDIDSTEWLV
jgi:hypothetical protein